MSTVVWCGRLGVVRTAQSLSLTLWEVGCACGGGHPPPGSRVRLGASYDVYGALPEVFSARVITVSAVKSNNNLL